jgi:hypothetical protein
MRKRVKTASAVFFICCLLCSLLPAGFSLAAQTPLQIMVAADTHFQCTADLGAFSDEYTEHLLNREVYGYASTQGQMPYESEAILAQMLEEFAASDAACLLIAGDLTCGKRQSHLRLAELLRQTEARSGKQIFVINGNHDCDAESSDNGISMEEFREIYADFGYTEACSRHAQGHVCRPLRCQARGDGRRTGVCKPPASWTRDRDLHGKDHAGKRRNV